MQLNYNVIIIFIYKLLVDITIWYDNNVFEALILHYNH